VNPSVVTLTVSTGRKLASNIKMENWAGAAASFALAGLLLPIGMRRKCKRAFTVLCLLGMGLCGAGCGSSSGSSSGANASPESKKPRTVTVVVTATSGAGSGARTKSTPLMVTLTK
jgi:hypothetical protein